MRPGHIGPNHRDLVLEGVSVSRRHPIYQRKPLDLHGVALVVLMMVVMVVVVMVMVVVFHRSLILGFLNETICLVGGLHLLHGADHIRYAGQRRRLGLTYVAKR
jgi:hypothetical protein